MQSHNAWIEVNLDALHHNITSVKSHLAPGVKLLAVVKADAYGLGALACAKQFILSGADLLAVSTYAEAMQLREGGIEAPILVFMPMLAKEADAFWQARLLPSIDTESAAAAWQQAGGGPFHLVINTGMNRFGINAAEAVSFCKKIAQLSSLQLQGIYSHIACGQNKDPGPAQAQIALFRSTLQELAAAGFYQRGDVLAHLAASSAILRFPEAHFDMVRAGTLLYGQFPAYSPHNIELQEPYAVKARLVGIRRLQKGDAVGYGADFIAKKEMRIGVIPLGYADGLGNQLQTRPATLSNSIKEGLKMLRNWVKPKRAAICSYQGKSLLTVGRIAMQATAIDLGKTALQLGDIVQVRLRRTAAPATLPRFYMSQNKIIWQNYVTTNIEEIEGKDQFRQM